MKNLTRERAHDLCVEMWNEIAENGYLYKHESHYVKKHRPEFECFACEFYRDYELEYCDADIEPDCLTDDACPFHIYRSKEEPGTPPCLCEGSPYEKRELSEHYDPDENKELAIEIADLFIGEVE